MYATQQQQPAPPSASLPPVPSSSSTISPSFYDETPFNGATTGARRISFGSGSAAAASMRSQLQYEHGVAPGTRQQQHPFAEVRNYDSDRRIPPASRAQSGRPPLRAAHSSASLRSQPTTNGYAATDSTRSSQPLQSDSSNSQQQQPASARSTLLTLALQRAQSAVLLDSANNHHAAVSAYSQSVRLLREVMQRVQESVDREREALRKANEMDESERSERRRERARRRVEAKLEEARRLRIIHDTYEDRVRMLSNDLATGATAAAQEEPAETQPQARQAPPPPLAISSNQHRNTASTSQSSPSPSASLFSQRPVSGSTQESAPQEDFDYSSNGPPLPMTSPSSPASSSSPQHQTSMTLNSLSVASGGKISPALDAHLGRSLDSRLSVSSDRTALPLDAAVSSSTGTLTPHGSELYSAEHSVPADTRYMPSRPPPIPPPSSSHTSRPSVSRISTTTQQSPVEFVSSPEMSSPASMSMPFGSLPGRSMSPALSFGSSASETFAPYGGGMQEPRQARSTAMRKNSSGSTTASSFHRPVFDTRPLQVGRRQDTSDGTVGSEAQSPLFDDEEVVDGLVTGMEFLARGPADTQNQLVDDTDVPPPPPPPPRDYDDTASERQRRHVPAPIMITQPTPERGRDSTMSPAATSAPMAPTSSASSSGSMRPQWLGSRMRALSQPGKRPDLSRTISTDDPNVPAVPSMASSSRSVSGPMFARKHSSPAPMSSLTLPPPPFLHQQQQQQSPVWDTASTASSRVPSPSVSFNAPSDGGASFQSDGFGSRQQLMYATSPMQANSPHMEVLSDSPALNGSSEHMLLAQPASPLTPVRRPFALMRVLRQSMMPGSAGAHVTPRLFVTRDVWTQTGVKLLALETKCRMLELVIGGLESAQTHGEPLLPSSFPPAHSLHRSETGGATASAERFASELDSFESLCDGVQGTLEKKLGSFIGAGAQHRRDGLSSKKAAASSFSAWSSKLSRSLDRVTTGKSLDSPATYVECIARAFLVAQVLDSHLESLALGEGLYAPGQVDARVRAKIAQRLRRASEFFGTVMCRFVLRDMAVLLDKFVKRGGAWIAAD